MKKLICMLTALVLCLSCVGFAGAEGRTEVITLKANPTTGYIWYGFVMGGSSAALDSEEGVYTPDEAPEGVAGSGGVTTFTVTALEPGQSILVFHYMRPWEREILDRAVYLADVDEDGNLYLQDVTEYGVCDAVVAALDEETRSAVLMSETLGEMIATFAPDLALPAVDENITIYTNGTMTMSLPPIVNVLAWAAIPTPDARL